MVVLINISPLEKEMYHTARTHHSRVHPGNLKHGGYRLYICILAPETPCVLRSSLCGGHVIFTGWFIGIAVHHTGRCADRSQSNLSWRNIPRHDALPLFPRLSGPSPAVCMETRHTLGNICCILIVCILLSMVPLLLCEYFIWAKHGCLIP